MHRRMPVERRACGAHHGAPRHVARSTAALGAERAGPDMSDRDDGAPGRDERRVRGPVQRKGFGLAPTGWVDPRGRTLGAWAFAANRITGLGLVFYLYLHLGVLTTLL